MAPFFVLLEVGFSSCTRNLSMFSLEVNNFNCLILFNLQALQMLFGYEPYPGFHARVKAQVEAEIKEWKDKKEKKIS